MQGADLSRVVRHVGPAGPFGPADAAPDPRLHAEPGRSRTVRHVLMTADAVGGVWRYTIDLGRALAARGVRTTVAVMGPFPSPSQRREGEAAGLAILDRSFRLEWMENPWDDVRRAGGWLLALERALLPDVVHLNGYAHAALEWRAPVVVVAHSCVRSWWRAVKGEEAPARFKEYREAIAAGLLAARVVIAPTAAMLRALEEEYGPALRARVIPNGCMVAGGHAEPFWGAKEEVVLSAGRAWDEGKNIAALCAVAGQLSWPVCVAGEARAPEAPSCELPGVRRLGHLLAPELASWYRRAAIYALPARYEPFGLSVLEAASAGCALVLGDILSLRENWSDAATFVDPNDGPALGAALEDLISNPVRREALARRAWARSLRFTIDRTADEYLKTYEDLLG